MEVSNRANHVLVVFQAILSKCLIAALSAKQLSIVNVADSTDSIRITTLIEVQRYQNFINIRENFDKFANNWYLKTVW